MLRPGRDYRLIVGTVGDGRNSGLVDDTEDFDDTEDVENNRGDDARHLVRLPGSEETPSNFGMFSLFIISDIF